MRQHVRTFKMHMRINKPWSQEFARRVELRSRIVARSRCMNTGNHGANDAYVRRANFTRDYIDNASTVQQQVESSSPLSRVYGANSCSKIDLWLPVHPH